MTTQPDDYDPEKETASSVRMLDEIIPPRLREMYHLLGENAGQFEVWRVDLFTKLLLNVEWNCRELRETIAKDKLPTAAWIGRNLLELYVWTKYCGVGRDNAQRFHHDALRDIREVSESHKQRCVLQGIQDETSASRAQKINAAASKFGIDVNLKFLAAKDAAAVEGVNLGPQYLRANKFFSKFAHPSGPRYRHHASGRGEG